MSSAPTPDLPDPLRPIDRAWLRMDEPDNLMVITGVMLLETIDLSSLRAVLERRLMRVRRFRQRLGFERGAPVRWEDDPDFQIDRHVERLVLPAPGNKRNLQAEVSRLMSQPLPRDRPLWHFWLVEHYDGGSVLVSRLHHAIGDGVALMMVLLSLTDTTAQAEPLDLATGAEAAQDSPFAALFDPDQAVRDQAVTHAAKYMPEVMSLMARSGGAVPAASRARVTGKLGAAFSRLVLRPPDPRTAFKGRLTMTKRVTWSDEVPIDHVRAIKDQTGGTINDVLLTAMTGALRRYLVDHGHRVDGIQFRAAVPVSLRKVDQLAAMGNQFGLVFLKLPVGLATRAERLAVLRKRMAALKQSYEAGVVLGFLHGMGMSPQIIQRVVERVFGLKATAVMTNVPGPRETLYFGGRTIRDMLFWVPQSGRLGMGISILSYAGNVRLGITTDHGLVPHPEKIADAFHAELEAMYHEAVGAG